jgi:hypothetical protein
MPVNPSASGRFQCRYLGQSAQVPLGLAVPRGKEYLDEIPGDRRAFGPPAKAEHVQMIILDPLPRGEMILDQRGAHASDLFGTDAGADAAAADRHAALHLRCGDGARERRYEVRIVVVRVEASRAEIYDLVPRRATRPPIPASMRTRRDRRRCQRAWRHPSDWSYC